MLGFQIINVQRHVLEIKALSKFWTFSRQNWVRTSGPVFIKVQSEFARGSSKKNTKCATSFLESLRAPSEHDWSKEIQRSEVGCYAEAELLIQS